MGQEADPRESTQIGWLTTGSILLIVAILASGLLLPKGANWLVVISLMTFFIALIGKLITNRWSGILINERKKMTLSRFQLVLWTLIVLSAFLTIALERIQAGVTEPGPLAIALPPELWYLLGISTTSLVGSPLILSTKVPKKPADPSLERGASLRAARKIAAIDAVGTSSELQSIKEKNPAIFAAATISVDANAEISKEEMDTIKDSAKKAATKIAKEEIGKSAVGTLDFNEKIDDAKFSELFTGDEVMNRGIVDMAKVQMFFFTLLIAFSYMVLLVNLIWTKLPVELTSFPALDPGLVALLGISSAGYLANKVPDHTKIAPS